MKALILDIKREEWEATRGLNLGLVPEPELNESKDLDDAGRVIVKPLYTGFCGSDKAIWHRHAFRDMIFDSMREDMQSYRVCGHELLGEVVEVGSYAAKHYGYKAGDTVSTESHIFCGVCHQCKIGDAHVCANHRIIGISMDGCFAEYVKLPAKELWPTDLTRIRPEVAAIQEPLGNSVHACGRVDLSGKRIAIFGCGTVGLFSIIVARSMGATTIIGIDPKDDHLKMAERLGADAVLKVSREQMATPKAEADREIVEKIRKLCFGEGVDVAFEMAGSNQAVNSAIQATRGGGDIILFGLSAGDYTLTNFQEIIMRGKTLHSVVGRKVFQTWFTVNNLLQSRGHEVQEKIYEVILNKGEGTVYSFHDFDAGEFEKMIQKHPKTLLRY